MDTKREPARMRPREPRPGELVTYVDAAIDALVLARAKMEPLPTPIECVALPRLWGEMLGWDRPA